MSDPEERARRWRLVIGTEAAPAFPALSLTQREMRMDDVLGALYTSDRRGSLGSSSPNAVRWLGDIRTYFPSSVVRVLQADAFARLGLRRMLLEPELLAGLVPDVHLVAQLLLLRGAIPAKTRDTARTVVRAVTDELERRLASPLREAVRGSLARSVRNARPRYAEVDWPRTIHANLRHYQPAYATVVPERLVGFGRRDTSLRDIILCIDQSGSMARSVVHASIAGAVLASLRSVSTTMIAFDTSVVDLTAHVRDPVELLFGAQLGGGTDIARALAYVQTRVKRPADTIVVLISDLCEGGDREALVGRAAALVAAGVLVVALLALDDGGAPAYDREIAAAFAALGIAAFACSPDLFPDLMAAALARRDLGAWASEHDIARA
jgi:Mg-chelatase subunit ChlD